MTGCYYKVRQVLQSVTDCYYKVRQTLLQSASGITKCYSYYKVRRNKHSFNNFCEVVKILLDKHTPYQKVKKHNLKLKTKPWITDAIQNSIKMKKKTFWQKYGLNT